MRHRGSGEAPHSPDRGAQGAAHNEQLKGADCVLRIDLEKENMVARVRDGEDFLLFKKTPQGCIYFFEIQQMSKKKDL